MTSKRYDEFYSYLLMKIESITKNTGVEPIICDLDSTITWVFKSPQAEHIIQHIKGGGGSITSTLGGTVVRRKMYKHLSGLERHSYLPLKVQATFNR
jgi:hypothetical protein